MYFIQPVKVSIAAVYNVKTIWLKSYIIENIYLMNRSGGNLDKFRNSCF